jgi:hypothetical protein
LERQLEIKRIIQTTNVSEIGALILFFMIFVIFVRSGDINAKPGREISV